MKFCLFTFRCLFHQEHFAYVSPTTLISHFEFHTPPSSLWHSFPSTPSSHKTYIHPKLKQPFIQPNSNGNYENNRCLVYFLLIRCWDPVSRLLFWKNHVHWLKVSSCFAMSCATQDSGNQCKHAHILLLLLLWVIQSGFWSRSL